ncbi:MAG: DUF3866 family protein [Paeniclostridium sordellii]|uniref:DUF3866 family protein n=1 Tax=Paeniclostridium hominis TaxID=2764329 RepID=A0ABR7K496_9FIRM|nr:MULTISPECIES: DUF3866 family protein [Paeniclostridium]MBC6003914.1 DUF3866 family protein [Paeniclostridium hominis]MBC8631091.1 DUF3866 family protein [[Eubacterium] tenue]MDU1538855.1 DUF3866 family protein [Paeniclostridium sordellii]MDU2592233.1 DUF3866 family protein [Paeniclostridium sordellii]
MISKKIGLVESIISKSENLEEITVNVNGDIAKAYNYPKMTGSVDIGNEVVLNTTAVELSLGTGGYHFVILNLNKLESNMTPGGHIMKLRYTPMQVKVDSVEEQDSKLHDKINEFKSLENLPVVVGTLHSMLTPFAASYKRHNPNKKLVYIMTDGASLPIYLSKNVENLKNKKLIDDTITIGNAFGGDYECINIYSALITAKEVLNADAVFVSMGPGIAGTGTKYGFTGIEQGPILDAVKKLGGNPIAIPRISFADKRDRHVGISHHSITVLSEIVNVNVNIPIGIEDKDKLEYVNKQIEKNNLQEKHNIVYIKPGNTFDDLSYYGLKVKSMGRNYEQDSEFFDAASNAAYYLMEVCYDNRGTDSK